jgi:hypothetical protein
MGVGCYGPFDAKSMRRRHRGKLLCRPPREAYSCLRSPPGISVFDGGRIDRFAHNNGSVIVHKAFAFFVFATVLALATGPAGAAPFTPKIKKAWRDLGGDGQTLARAVMENNSDFCHQSGGGQSAEIGATRRDLEKAGKMVSPNPMQISHKVAKYLRRECKKR